MRRSLLVFGVLLSACGARTQLVYDEPMDAGVLADAGYDAGRDAGRDAGHDAGHDGGWDAGRDAGFDAGLDAGGCLFEDGVEGAAQWDFGSLWGVSSIHARNGTRSLYGFWMDFSVGCPGTSAAKMNRDVDLRGVTSATLRFSQLGGVCEYDTLRIVVSTDRGRTWSTLETPADPQWTRWSTFLIDLGRYLGQPTVRIGFEFDNVCGDPCGVEWYIDDVSICAL